MAKKKWRDKKQLKQKAFEIPPQTSDIIDSLADELGLPKSQVITLLVHIGQRDLSKVNLSPYLKPSRSPLYRYTLDLEKFLEDYT